MLVVIFSKDRPLQLDATLRSFIRQCRDFQMVSVKVIVKASSDGYANGYNILQKEYQCHSNIELVPEGDFRQQVLELIRQDDYLLWLVDDNIFVRDFSLDDSREQLAQNQDALCYSLRLGKNTTYCYPLDKQQALPDFRQISPSTLKYNWTTAEYDFGYPLEVSSSLYRTRDLLPLLESINFFNPNSLEGEMATHSSCFKDSHPFLLCPPISLTFCNPINKVQSTASENRAGEIYHHTPELLLMDYMQGKRIVIEKFDGFVPNACHQEIPFPFEQRAKGWEPRNVAVSVVMPCYNYGRFLPEALPTVLAQTYSDYEVIIVNDGSTDDSLEIAERLLDRFQDQPIRLITQDNAGLMAARDTGVRTARGRYIVFLDPDDKLEPGFLAKTCNVLDSEPSVGFVYTQYRTFGLECQFFPQYEYSLEELKAKCIVTASALFRRELWLQVSNITFHRKIIGEDWDFWLSCAELGAQGELIPEILIHYRRHGTNNTMTASGMNQYPLPYLILRHPTLYNKQIVAMARQFIVENDPVNIDAAWLLPVIRKFPGCQQDESVQHYPGRFVNICMITYNRLEFTRQAIDALVRCTDFPYVLTVVDNASTDGTRGYLQEQKRKGIIKNLVLLDENVGVAKASNLAWSLEPDAGYYLKLDNDIVIQKHGWLGDMVRIIDDEQSFGALAYSFEPTSYPLVSVKGHSLRLKNGNLGGACFLIPARTRGKIGFWCEDYGLYSEEDYDYCFRLSLAGLRYAYMADEEVGFHLPAGKAAKIDENSLIATDGVEETSQQTYRLWKDEIRRQTISSGLRDRNLLGYKNGTKSICIASHYTTAWINAGRPGLVQPSFQSASSHPMKVAVFSHDGSHHACGYYRVYSPAKALGESVSFTWPVKTENGSFKIDLSGLHECDLFIIQRFFPHEVSMPFIEQLMGMGKPVIFELDDLITDIPADNSTHDWAQQCQPHIEELLKKCVAITVSTEELGIKLSCYNEHVYVLPNLIDLTLWRKQAPRSCGPVVIGYAGTMTHASDIALLEPVLERLSAKYGNNVAFTFMGCATERLSKLAGFQFIPFELSFEAYAKKLQDTPFDIMLAPLEDNVFNRCKSNIKWLEYSSCGIAGVYADLPPYNSSVKHGETGLLAGRDPEQWFQAICLLIDQPPLRRKIAEQSRNEVLTNYTFEKNAGLWLEAYQEIMEKFHNESLVPASMAVPQQQDCKVQLVSIVIPVFNQLHFTQQCLQALFETLPTETGCEIIVVNNASSDGTDAYLCGLGERVRVISNATNLGFAKACNQGARAARGKYLLFLNNDTVVQPGWLEPLLKAIQSGEADICGARLLYPDGRCQHAGIAFDERGLGYHIFGGFPGDAPEVTQRREMQAVTGACLMISKQLFAELEGFDEEFRNGFEDVDLCLRAGEYGKKILYLPESVVIHYAEQTPGRKDHDIPNMQRFFKRWSGKLRQDDQQLYRQFGLTCSKDQEGRFRITRDAGSVLQVSIIIPLFNQVGLTQACLAALQCATKAGSYELVLVDNGSTDGTAELLERWRHAATVIRNLENGGFAKACNQGARAARGEYLLFLNNDTVVQHGWLEPLLEVLEQDASVAAVGSKLLYPDGTIQHAGVLLVDDQQQGDPLVARHLYQRMPGDHPAANMLRSMQALTAACLLVRRTDFETVGGFDEGYWNGYEDVDLCLKLAAAGKRLVYQPASVVVHHESQSGPERFRQAGANIQRLHQRWLGKVQVDAIIQADGTIQHGPGMLSGTTAIYQPPAAPATVQAKQPTASARPRQYQLVPLVAGSASSLLQRLSSSRTTRDVLQRYTTDV